MLIDLLVQRYRDCYRVSEGLVTTGGLLKIAAWVVGILFVAFAVLSGQSHSDEAFGGVQNAVSNVASVISVAIAIASWIFFFSWGVLFCAAGQLLRATLDTAVHTSPFLPTDARVAAMGLPVRPAVPSQSESPGRV